MNSCGDQRVVLGIFRGLMADKVVFEVPLLMGFVTAFLVDVFTALLAFAGADWTFVVTAFDFKGLGAADLDVDADGRAMVNSFGAGDQTEP
jgi:ammonia channel protein AmtB